MKASFPFLLKALKLPVTANWILGGFLVSFFFSILKWWDPKELARIEYWHLWLIFGYDLIAALFLNIKLAKGSWSIPKWSRLSFIFWYVPMIFANAFLAGALDFYLIVPIATLYAGFLGVIGIYEKKYFLRGGTVYIIFYLGWSLYFRGIENTLWVTYSIIYSAFAWISLYWLSLTSHFVSSQNNTIQKLLRNSRKDKRELAEERKTIKNLIERLNKSFTIIKKDLSTAKKIQSSILPGNPEKYKLPITVFCKYLPMNEVGGDFYDICVVSPSKTRLFIADATGHGVQGALITMLIKVEYEFLKTTLSDPAELLMQLNRDYCNRYRPLKMFYTCVIVDIDSNAKEIQFVSAGHPSQVLIHKGQIVQLPRTGRMIGLTEDTEYKIETYPFEEKDKLILFTDGLIEQFNKQKIEFGEDRLYKILLQTRDDQISEQVLYALSQLEKHLEDIELQDDITVIGCLL